MTVQEDSAVLMAAAVVWEVRTVTYWRPDLCGTYWTWELPRLLMEIVEFWIKCWAISRCIISQPAGINVQGPFAEESCDGWSSLTLLVGCDIWSIWRAPEWRYIAALIALVTCDGMLFIATGVTISYLLTICTRSQAFASLWSPLWHTYSLSAAVFTPKYISVSSNMCLTASLLVPIPSPE